MNYSQDSSAIRTSSPAINVPARTFNNCSYTAATVASGIARPAGCGTGGVNGVSYSFAQTVLPGYTIPAQTWLANNNGTTNGLYLTPTNPVYVPSPRRTMFTTPSVTLDYTWNDKIDLKSITADTSDETTGWTFGGGGGLRTSVLPYLTMSSCPSGSGSVAPILASTCVVSPQYLQLPAAGGVALPGVASVAGPADVFGYYLFNNRRNQVTQEFRVSTIDPSWKLQFVAGLYIEHEHNHVNVGSNWNENMVATQLRGVTEAYFAGGEYPVPTQETPGNNLVDVSTRNIDILEDEQSVFGEVNYNLTSKLKFTAGVRVTNYTQVFNQIYGGAVAGAPNGFIGTSDTGAVETNPTSLAPFPTNYAACAPNPATGAAHQAAYAAAGCPYQYTNATLHEHPVTPKVGASYQLTPSDLLYVTYAEGERPGGVNPPVPPVQCASDLANLGVTSSPLTYQHDTVKSTEAGGKFRLFDGQAQVNASAFHIEWDGVQFVVPLPLCAFSFIANAAQANSDGGEIQATGRIFGFTVNGNLGYDHAVYASSVLGPKNAVTGAQAVLANKGDNLGIPDWTGNIGVQYDTRVMEFPTYARMDYTYSGKYMRATSMGTSSFNAAVTPNYINGNETHIANARVGVYYNSLEVALYVKNIFNSDEWLNKTQGYGSYYFSGTTVQPRVIGFQTNYRF
jgi:outer membrane receptor protein involved in Fe transport